MSTHECPAPKCDRRVPADQYACRQHWFMLPRDLRDQIWQEYRREPGSYTHLDAMEAATHYLRAHARS